jgi:hypothetical protein
MFCALGLIFGGIECVRSRFHILRSRTCFRQYQRRPVPFSCFALSDSFSAVQTTSGPVFMFCAPRLDFGIIGGVTSHFQVLCSRTHFRWYRGRQVSFSYFALPDSFLAVPRASGPVFMFCALRLFFSGIGGVGSRFLILRARTRFDGTEGLVSRFLVLRSRTRFRRYWGRRV